VAMKPSVSGAEPAAGVRSPRGGLAALGSGTTVGPVRLTVSNLQRSRSFYESVIGLEVLEEPDDVELGLGPAGGPVVVTLRGDGDAPPLNRRATGLFHLAILVPSRRDLAHALARLAQARWPLDGASDHLVSEALYLSDPDGNGIEIYRDRPREQWRRDSSGQLAMATLALDLRDLAGALGDGAQIASTIAPGTRLGHVHLQVSSIDDAEAFYHGLLGFDVTVRSYPGALFLSAGGYHHHVGANTWNSAGAPPPPPGAVGLRAFEVVLESQAELDGVLERVGAAGLTPELDGVSGRFEVRDPAGNAVVLGVR